MINTEMLYTYGEMRGQRSGVIPMKDNDRVNMVIDDVEEITGIPAKDIRGKRRFEQTSLARFMVYAGLRSLGLSLPSVGRAMKRDHGAVINGIQRLKGLSSYDKRTMHRIELMRRKGYKL